MKESNRVAREETDEGIFGAVRDSSLTVNPGLSSWFGHFNENSWTDEDIFVISTPAFYWAHPFLDDGWSSNGAVYIPGAGAATSIITKS